MGGWYRPHPHSLRYPPNVRGGRGQLVLLAVPEVVRFITAFDDEYSWKRHQTKIRNLAPVKAGLGWGAPRASA